MAITVGNISILNPIERKVYGTGEKSVVFLQPKSTQPTYQSSGAPYIPAPKPKPKQGINLPTTPTAAVTQETDLHTIDPWQMGAAATLGMFGVPAAILGGIAGLTMQQQQGLPTQKTTEVTGIKQEQAVDLAKDIIPQGAAQPGAAQPTGGGLGDIMGGVQGVAGLALAIAPLILIFGLMGSLKKLF
jgi:hypothetical protein